MIASCALFTLPVSSQHTSPPSHICVCTYNRTAEANFDSFLKLSLQQVFSILLFIPLVSFSVQS